MNPALASSLNVSRETFERLEHYVALLHKWNPKINLVSRGTLQDVWERHIRDSLQVFEAAEGLTGAWVDLGSGGGLPGLVVALAQRPGFSVTLVESDQRKAAFLRTVLRETGSTGTVIAERIEATEPQSAAVLSAPALWRPCRSFLGFASVISLRRGSRSCPKASLGKTKLPRRRSHFHFTVRRLKAVPKKAPSSYA